MHVFSLIAIVLHFVTTSDSASLVVDVISSNGEENPPVVQRVFWALIEGAAATALLYYGSTSNLDPQKAFTVISGLPMTFVLDFCCISLWRVLNKELEWNVEQDLDWNMYFGNINSIDLLKKVTFSVFCPWYYLGEIVIKQNQYRRMKYKLFAYLQFAIPFYLWIILLIPQFEVRNIDKFGWVCLLVFFAYTSTFRKVIREEYKIEGNFIEDFFVMMIYPFTIVQMYVQINTTPIEQNGNVVQQQVNPVFEGSTFGEEKGVTITEEYAI